MTYITVCNLYLLKVKKRNFLFTMHIVYNYNISLHIIMLYVGKCYTNCSGWSVTGWKRISKLFLV